MTQSPIVLHGLSLSGHVHRVELLLIALGLPYRFAEASAETRGSDAFRAMNPLRQVPVLQDGDVTLSDSNAIMVYLAKRYDGSRRWLPEEAIAAAQVQRWLSIAAGEVAHGPGAARLIAQFGVPDDPARADRIAAKLLGFMEEHLAGRSVLVGDHPTIADLACVSYVAHAPEGGIGLDAYPAVRAWIARITALPFYKAMPASPLPLPKAS